MRAMLRQWSEKVFGPDAALWRPYLWVGVAATFVTLVVRWWQLDDPYWTDEVVTMRTAGGSWEQFFRSFFARSDVSPPLFHGLLKLWLGLFGTSPAATAVFSLLWCVLAVVAAYRVGTVLFNRTVGVVAALIFWNTYLAIRFSTETRMYAFVMLISLWSAVCCYQYLMSGRRDHLFWYLAATVLGLYTHYQFLLLVFAQVTIAALLQLHGRLPRPKAWWLGQGALAAVFLPWLPVMLWWVGEHYLIGRDAWIEAAFPAGTWHFYFSVFHIFLYPTWTSTWWTNQIVGWYIVAFLLALVVRVERRPDGWIIARALSPVFPVVYLLASIGIPALLLWRFNIGVFRYYAATGPLFVIVLAAAVVTVTRRYRTVLPAVLLLVAVSALNLLAVAGWRLPL